MIEATPDKASVLREFGPSGYREKPDGSWTYDVPAEKSARWIAMTEERRRADVERGAVLQGTMPRFTVRDQEGVTRHIPCSSEATGQLKERQMAAKGLIRAHTRYGGARIESDADGFLWRQLPGGKGWEPLGRKCLTRPWLNDKGD